LYRTAQFLTSAALLAQAPPDQGFEVAFTGRSNAGKSSAINALCDQNQLTRTSKTPGRTQLINFFQLDAFRRLVDLPGYGYAAAPEAKQQQWQDSMTDYLTHRECLQGLILLMDIRHPLTDYDRNLIHWSAARTLPVHILLTKADKLKRGPALAQLNTVQQHLKQLKQLVVTVQIFSALKRQGIDQVHTILDTWLAVTTSHTIEN
jgi:GTP-binding protein